MRAAALGRGGALLALAMAGCATAPRPGARVAPERFAQAVAPGVTTKAQLVATLGSTRAVVFDSGYEAWLYQSPAGAGRYTELVVLVGPDGIVRKTRRRDP